MASRSDKLFNTKYWYYVALALTDVVGKMHPGDVLQLPPAGAITVEWDQRSIIGYTDLFGYARTPKRVVVFTPSRIVQKNHEGMDAKEKGNYRKKP